MLLIAGPEIAAYGFPGGHPFGPDRHAAFMAELERSPSFAGLARAAAPQASRAQIEYFHSPGYVETVLQMSAEGSGLLDQADTPAFPGVYEAAAHVVGGTLSALAAIVAGPERRAFIPIGGLHHAARTGAAGFCVFNDCAIAIEAARRDHGLTRIAYVDIDAHHGDGVFYGFEDDPEVIIADLHEDGRFLYPGTGARAERGTGPAAGTKLNVPMPPGAGDEQFFAAWRDVRDVPRAHAARARPAAVRRRFVGRGSVDASRVQRACACLRGRARARDRGAACRRAGARDGRRGVQPAELGAGLDTGRRGAGVRSPAAARAACRTGAP